MCDVIEKRDILKYGFVVEPYLLWINNIASLILPKLNNKTCFRSSLLLDVCFVYGVYFALYKQKTPFTVSGGKFHIHSVWILPYLTVQADAAHT